MKKISTYFILFNLALLIGGCSLIYEDDLSKVPVYIIMPEDGQVSISQSQYFWWEPVPGAENYNLQIVSPDFNAPEKFILDTTMAETRLSISLAPGQYSWRVSAENAYSFTDYTICNLTINKTPDLSQQQLVLKSPGDNISFSDTSLHFSWYALEGASNYTIEIRKDSWSGSLVTLPINMNSCDTLINLQEGSYYWGVKAINDFSATSFTVWSFRVDTTAPGIPGPLTPVNDSVINGSKVEFYWTIPVEENDSGIQVILSISQDSLFSENMIVHNKKYHGSDCIVDIGTLGIYYWRIRSEDSAGNLSPYCEFRCFNLQSE